jgi:hypothetical protein
MPVFSRYNPKPRNSVLLQAHPNAEPYPWIPHRTTTRTDDQWGAKNKVARVQPHERGKHFYSSRAGSWANTKDFVDTTNPLAPQPTNPGIAPNHFTGGGGGGSAAGGCACGGGVSAVIARSGRGSR